MMGQGHPCAAPEDLAGIPSARLRRFDEGCFLAECGAPAHSLYLIRAGQVRCFLLDQEGRETTTAALGRGQLVGIAPFVGRTEYHDFAQALSKVEAWVLPVEAVQQQLPASSALVGLLLGCLARRVEAALALLKDVALLPAGERVRDIEARLTACAGVSPAALRRTTLAGLLQIRPETLARTQTGAADGALSRRLPATPWTGHRQWTFHPNEVIGDVDWAPGSLGLVRSGQLELSASGAGARTLWLETLGEGDVFGVSALLGLPPVGLTLTAVSAGVVQLLEEHQLPNWLAERPEQSLALLQRLAARLERLEHALARAGRGSVNERLIDLLNGLASARPQAGAGVVRVVSGHWSHGALARQIGASRESVTRGLATLEKEGAISRAGGDIVLQAERTTASDAYSAPPDEPLRGPADPARRGATTSARQRRGRRTDRSGSSALRTGTRRMPRERHGREHPASAPPTPRLKPGKCVLCGLLSPHRVCGGCAERLEFELQLDPASACPACGRHRELCQALPCAPAPEPQARDDRAPGVVWLPIDRIDEPDAARNSRQRYQDSAIRELAASLREHGFLQPVCVRPSGARYEVVFGVRRLRAAAAAGFREVPCTVRAADAEHAFLLNALENLHRTQLSSTERLRTIERMAASGLGVREISRRTGFNPSSISRWLRIQRSPHLRAALEEGTLDVARAVILAEAPSAALDELIERAPRISCTELRERVAAVKHSPHPGAVGGGDADEQFLRDALRRLQRVRFAGDAQLIEQLRGEVERLLCGPLGTP